MSIFSTSSEADKINIAPNRWVRFIRDFDWEIPKYGGRAHKFFRKGKEIRLTRRQFKSAWCAGAVVSIPHPRSSGGGDVLAGTSDRRPSGLGPAPEGEPGTLLGPGPEA